MFQELWAHKLLINAKKSEFFLEEIHYLGHIILIEGIRMTIDKSHTGMAQGPSLKRYMKYEVFSAYALIIGGLSNISLRSQHHYMI